MIAGPEMHEDDSPPNPASIRIAAIILLGLAAVALAFIIL